MSSNSSMTEAPTDSPHFPNVTFSPTLGTLAPTSAGTNATNVTNPRVYPSGNMTLVDWVSEPFYPEFITYPVGLVYATAILGLLVAQCATTSYCRRTTRKGYVGRRVFVYALAYLALVFTLFPETLTIRVAAYMARCAFHRCGGGPKAYSDGARKRLAQAMWTTVLFSLFLIGTMSSIWTVHYVEAIWFTVVASVYHVAVFSPSRWVVLYMFDMGTVILVAIFLSIPHGRIPQATYVPLIMSGITNLVAYGFDQFSDPFGPETTFPGMDESINDGTDGGIEANGSGRQATKSSSAVAPT